MEGDAGASRLNPTDADDSLNTEVGADQISSEVTTEDSGESEVAADVAEADAKDAESSAGAAREPDEAPPVVGSPGAERGPSRLSRGWFGAIAAALLLVAGGLGAGGYLALRSHQESEALARNDAAAIRAAKDCVAATQAPDTSTMAASEQKIIDCGTDEFRTQALLYSSMLVQAYQVANVHVQVSDSRAAVERNNNDGSVQILVALRVKISSDQAQNQENGYRLRVKMTPVDGQYKISKLDQVTQ